jgi:hypothetical protein
MSSKKAQNAKQVNIKENQAYSRFNIKGLPADHD